MLPEDRFDALLSSRGTLPQPYASLSDDDATFAPLLAAASQLAVLADARPSASFAQALEARFLARAVALADADSATLLGSNTQAPPGNDYPTIPVARTFAGTPASTPTRQREMPPRRGVTSLRSRFPRLLPQAIAASLVLILGVGTLTAAAAARPGSFLFPLRRFEQGVQLGLSGSAADRFRLHLGYANDALTTLDSVHGDSDHSKSAYTQALTTLSDEERAAEKELAAVPSGTERDTLTAQLQAFKTQAAHDLFAILGSSAALDWQNRVAATQVLGQLGAQVPHIDAVRLSRIDDTSHTGDSVSGSRDTHSWQVTISGTGFTPGAQVMLNGHTAGTVTQLSPAQIIALVKTDDSGIAAGLIGIEESDGTAAQANDSTLNDDGHSGAPGVIATPTSRSGDNHSGDGDTHGGKPGGPNATPNATPEVTPTPRPEQP